MPQPNQYAQFGYGYPGFPTPQPAAGQTPTIGTPGAGAAQQGFAASGITGAAQPGAMDPSQAQGQAQQWGGQDQNAYAQSYWGGRCSFGQKEVTS